MTSYEAELIRYCGACLNTDAKLFSCSRCFDVRYCSKECQVSSFLNYRDLTCLLFYFLNIFCLCNFLLLNFTAYSLILRYLHRRFIGRNIRSSAMKRPKRRNPKGSYTLLASRHSGRSSSLKNSYGTTSRTSFSRITGMNCVSIAPSKMRSCSFTQDSTESWTMERLCDTGLSLLDYSLL